MGIKLKDTNIELITGTVLLDDNYQVKKALKEGKVEEFGLAIKPKNENKEITYIKQENIEDLEKLYEDYNKLVELLDYIKDYNDETRTQVEKIKITLKRIMNFEPRAIILGSITASLTVLCGILSAGNNLSSNSSATMELLTIIYAILTGAYFTNFVGIRNIIATSKISNEEKERLIKLFESFEMNEEEIKDSNAYYYIKTK